MIHIEEASREGRSEFNPTPETRYLISDLELLVNENAGEYLRDAPSEVRITGYKPFSEKGRTPYGVNRLRQAFPNSSNKILPELIDTDLELTFPTGASATSPLQVTFNWSNNLSSIIRTNDIYNIELTQNRISGDIVKSKILDNQKASRLFESLELPASIFSDSMRDFINDFSSADSLSVHQSASTVVDPMTYLQVTLNAHLRNDRDGERHADRELCIEVDHLTEHKSTHLDNASELYLPPAKTWRTMLRFTDEDNQWKFSGSYRGNLETGELLTDTVHNAFVAVPGNKTLEKALFALRNPPS